jgi:hypothetical protein
MSDRSFAFVRLKQLVLLLAMAMVCGFVLQLVACEEPKYPYDTCTQDTDCKSNQICRGGRCETADLTCRTDSECVGGRLCIKSKCQHVICQDNRDCEANEECSGGVCQVKSTESSTPDSGGGNDGGTTGTDTTPDNAKTDGSTTVDKGIPTICTPNRDGQIDRSELLFKVGTSVTYRVAGSSSNTIDVDLRGSKDANGDFKWDFSASYPNSKKEVDELLPIKGAWYEAEYTGASYAAILSRGATELFGVFQVTSSELLLQGVVSESSGTTKLKYDKPIALFQFPMKVGSKWTSAGTSSGTMTSVPFFRMQETYVFEIDAKGTVKTPAGEFPVLRLRLSLTQQQYSPAIFRRTSYTHYFLSECYGIIARVDSKQYESEPFFTKAAQIKLLSD